MRKAGREAGAKRNTQGSERVRRRSRGVAGWAEKRRPEAGGTRNGLAFGERGGGDDAGAFCYCDDLIGVDVLNSFVALTAGPADDDRADFGVSAEAKGEDQLAGREVAATASEHLYLSLASDNSSAFSYANAISVHDPDGGAEAVAIGFCADELDAEAVICGARVLEESGGAAVG